MVGAAVVVGQGGLLNVGHGLQSGKQPPYILPQSLIPSQHTMAPEPGRSEGQTLDGFTGLDGTVLVDVDTGGVVLVVVAVTSRGRLEVRGRPEVRGRRVDVLGLVVVVVDGQGGATGLDSVLHTS